MIHKLSALTAIISAVVSLSSCATSKYVSKEEIAAIDNVAIVEPFSYMEYHYENGRYKDYSDSLSKLCSEFVAEAIDEADLPFANASVIEYDHEDKSLLDAIASIRYIVPKEAAEFELPFEMDRLLEESGFRYGIFSFTNGYFIDRKTYVKRMVLGLTLGVASAILSMGTVVAYAIPYRGVINSWIAIADSESNKLVFFNSGVNTYGSQLGRKAVKRQVKYMLKPLKKLK